MIMAQQASTVDTLNGLFKESYASKIRDLVPEGVRLLKEIPFNSADKQPGNLYHAPITLGLEHGFTYGGGDGAVFQLNAAVASPMRDAQVKGTEMVLVSAISIGAASRSVSSKNSFEQATKRLVQTMLKSMHIRLEAQLLYGQVGIARVESISGNTVTICDAEWAPGIWAGAKNMQIEVRSQAGALRGSATVNNVDMKLKTITLDVVPAGVTGNVDPENAAADVIWFKGAYNKEFAGLHKMITNTGTIFNVDAAEYELYKGNIVNVGTDFGAGAAFISFEKIEEAIAVAMEKGLMDQDVVALVHPKHWNKLMTDLAAKRQFDSSYSEKEQKQGTQSIKFFGQNGMIEVQASLFVKQGFAYVYPKEELERIGSSDVTFEQPGMEGKFFRLMDSANGYELRAYCDQALFSPAIGMLTLLKYIKAE
jgi:hypothetical protein